MQPGDLQPNIPLTRRTLLGLAAAGLCGGLWPAGSRAAAEAGSGKLYVTANARQNDAALGGIFEVDPESGQWRKVADEFSPAARVAPDGRSLAFTRTFPGPEERGVWVADLKGDRKPRRVSDLVGHVVWAPDGRSLIVSGSTEMDSRTFQTWRIDLDGPGKAKLPTPEDELVIDWSSDDRWLLVLSRRAEEGLNFSVLARRLDGSDARSLIAKATGGTFRISPDGRSVLYSRQEKPNTFRYSLLTVAIDGGEPKLILEATDDRSPAFTVWSPDGKRLAVDLLEISPDEDAPRGKVVGRHIEVMDLDGTNRRRLDLPQKDAVPVDWR